MSRPGPPPKPLELKILHGSHETGLKKRAVQAPKPRPLTPPKPDWLDPVAEQEWDRMVVLLHRLGLLTEADGGVLATYCSAYSMIRRCQRKIQRFGLVSVAPSGYKQARPEVAILRQQEEILLRCAERFGLDPSSRARINGPAAGPAVAPRDLTLGGLLNYD